jgi:hypothetical protein
VLRLHRSGKEWALSYAEHHAQFNDENDPPEFKPLSDAPLKFKMAAVKMFPNLLEAIEKSQDKLLADLNQTAAEFDAFAASLKIPATKEGR